MTRDEMHLDAMLRHLGAAYYDSLHGRAAKTDVTRAVDLVAHQIGEKPGTHVPPARPQHGQAHHQVPRHHGRLHSRIKDVMTTHVVTVDRVTPFKEIAELLVEHKISGVPVLGLGRKVVGVVTEGDLIGARDTRAGKRRDWTGMHRYDTDYARYLRLTAEQLMTAPAVTTHPDASIAAGARLMGSHHVKRLPVVGPEGALVGIVSRRDLLNVFCVPDAEITRQVRELLAEVLPANSGSIKAAVHGGIVTVTGTTDAAAPRDSVAEAINLAWNLDGVVDIINHVTSSELVSAGSAGHKHCAMPSPRPAGRPAICDTGARLRSDRRAADYAGHFGIDKRQSTHGPREQLAQQIVVAQARQEPKDDRAVPPRGPATEATTSAARWPPMPQSSRPSGAG